MKLSERVRSCAYIAPSPPHALNKNEPSELEVLPLAWVADEIAELEAKLAAAEKDAARYRWLCNPENYPHESWWSEHIDTAQTPEQMNRAIDAAIEASHEPALKQTSA